MIRLVVLLLLYLSLIQSAKILKKPMLDGRIVGGQPVYDDTALSDVSMRINGAHACGGSLLTPSWISTAAHCTNGVSPTQVTVRIGSLFKSSGGKIVQVTNITQHENFNSDSNDYDIALLKVEIFDFSGLRLSYLNLPLQDEEVAEGTKLLVAGWGNTQNILESNERLRAVTVPVANQNSCKLVYALINNITPRMMCAGGGLGGKDSCQGDSGGALRLGKKLFGIVSFGNACGLPLYPGVYTSVATFRNWIAARISA